MECAVSEKGESAHEGLHVKAVLIEYGFRLVAFFLECMEEQQGSFPAQGSPPTQGLIPVRGLVPD